MDKVRYHEMLPHEIVARRKRCPVAFIGLGGLEFHGEHLAFGNDALKAEKLCEMAAEQSGGFAMPTLWYGEPHGRGFLEFDADPDGAAKRLMGHKKRKFAETYIGGRTADEQVAFYGEIIRHVLIQMNTLEMRAIVMLGGHYPLPDYIRPVIDQFNRDYADTQAYAAIDPIYYNIHRYGRPRHRPFCGDHAAKWETSFLSCLRPDCVDMTVYNGRAKEELIGVYGEDPRTEASVALGRRMVEGIVAGMVKKAQELLRKAHGA